MLPLYQFGQDILPTDHTIFMVMNIDNQLKAVGLRQVICVYNLNIDIYSYIIFDY